MHFSSITFWLVYCEDVVLTFPSSSSVRDGEDEEFGERSVWEPGYLAEGI